MSTLLLRLAAPLQSWGSDSKFERRTTGHEPTKSGVIGMLAAALGRRRDDPIDDLSMLKFGVRIDKPGKIIVDFHTARRLKKIVPGVSLHELYTPKNIDRTYVTRRYYLEDAEFLVGLEGDAEHLKILDAAVNAPFFPLFLGRRSCPPTGRISLGLKDLSLRRALMDEPGKSLSYSFVFDTDNVSVARQRDVPIGFSQRHRKFAYRYVEHKTMHDAFREVEE